MLAVIRQKIFCLPVCYPKLYGTIILPVFYGCETWSPTLREERRPWVFENRVLRSIFGPNSDEVIKEWGKLHNEVLNPLNPELNPICYLLALLGAHHFFHVSRIRVKLLTLRRLMSYIYGAPILDVSRSHTTTQHSR